jgi:hypothetical protein
MPGSDRPGLKKLGLAAQSDGSRVSSYGAINHLV